MNSGNFRTPRFFIRLNIQFENLGDILINLELVKLLSEHGFVVVDEQRCPADVRSALRAIANPRVSIVSGSWPFFSYLLRSRLRGFACWYLLCPGGTAGEVARKGWARRALRHGIQASMALAGFKFAFLGMSAERLGPNAVKWAKRRRNLTMIYYPRDNLTADYLSSIGILSDGVLPDLAFNLFEDDAWTNTTVRRIGISFRTDQNEKRVDRLKRLIVELHTLFGPEVEFVFAAQVKSDANAMRALENWTAETLGYKVKFKEEYTTPERAILIYSECDVVFSNRLHVLLLALRGCGRVAALVDDHNRKIIGVFNDISASDVLLPLDKPLSSDALQAALAVQIKGSEQRERLRNGIALLFGTDAGK